MKRVARWIAIGFVLVGLLAPFLANDLPLVASIDGELRWPAAASYFKRPVPPGDAASWKDWWASLAESKAEGDWAVLPLIPYGPHEPLAGRDLAGPEWLSHYFGNDVSGQDVLARLIHGTATALWVGLGSVLLALLIGVPLGIAAGYFGGWCDALVTMLLQVFLCFPPIFFVLAVMAFVGPSLLGIVLVLGALHWVAFARILRGEVLRIRERPYVQCARALGVSPIRVLGAHILPQVKGPVLVNTVFVAASAIVVEATLSFLGMGPGLATVSWGGLLMEGRDFAHLGAWHLWLFPSLVLVTVVFCLHTLADRTAAGPH